MADDVRIEIKPFDELTLRELHDCYRIRGEVFVVDQQICAEADPDEFDPRCHHVLLWQVESLAGTARLLPIEGGKRIKVGRVAVHRDYQGKGVGTTMMRAIQQWIENRPGRSGVMSAQAYLEAWYRELGWHRVGEFYMEAGIKHCKMLYAQPNETHAASN